jgi:hypothetical protein
MHALVSPLGRQAKSTIRERTLSLNNLDGNGNAELAEKKPPVAVPPAGFEPAIFTLKG